MIREVFLFGLCFEYEYSGEIPGKIALITKGPFPWQVQIYDLNQVSKTITNPIPNRSQTFFNTNDERNFIEENKNKMIVCQLKTKTLLIS